jgi:hypothetical protein
VSPELIGSLLAALLTLMVFSYLIGNNPLYRLAQHIFVGVSVGYLAMVLLTTVLSPQYLGQGFSGAGLLTVGVPMVLGVLLLVRLVRPSFGPATLALNVVTVTAAGLALGGALAGTLVPQMAATMLSLNPGQGGWLVVAGNAIIIVGVIVSLYYFSFGVRSDGRRGPLSGLLAGAGRWLIIGTLGAVLGTLTVSFVVALIDRIRFLFDVAGL